MLKQSLLASILLVLALPAFSETISTRFGSLEINDKVEGMGNEVLYQKKPLIFEEEGGYTIEGGFFNVEASYQSEDNDIFLIKNEGALGTACPVVAFFMTISKSDVKITKSFGTCSGDFEVKNDAANKTILVTMPGFSGPLTSEKERIKASNKKHTFIYKDGKVTEVKKKK